MSEYQYIAFRAIDAPVSPEQLKYMRQQSSRAEVTPWSFDNEYDYGDFNGNALEMLRRGYDIHLHYANYGIRSLFIRLPEGLPDKKAAQPYLIEKDFHFTHDKKGLGGILCIEPYWEPDDLEELWELDELLEKLLPIREEILKGDLRPFYLAHLAVCCDSSHDPEKTVEAPLPAGLNDLTPAQLALAELLGLNKELLNAAAESCPPATRAAQKKSGLKEWIKSQPEKVQTSWLIELLEDAGSGTKSKLLAKYRADQPQAEWPTVRLDRTVAELQENARRIGSAKKKATAAKAALNRKKKLAEMATDPTPVLRQTEALVAERSTEAYQQIGKLLVDLREALAETGREQIAVAQARKLHQAHPKLRHLTSALRKSGVLPK